MRNKLMVAGLFGYGILVGWAFTADHYEKKMKSNQRVLGDVINRQSQQIDHTRILLLNASEDHLDRIEQESAYDEESEEPEVPEGETLEQTRSNLQNLINSYTSDENNAHDFTNLAIETMEEDLTPPFVISRAKYAWDEDEGDVYSKITLIYYPRERILLDDENELIEHRDVNSTVGWRSLAQFGGESEDMDTVFVRNRRLLTDFEVVRDTENQPPAHIRYGMGRDEYETHKAAGLLRFRPEDA